jgi:hypothetical protein
MPLLFALVIVVLALVFAGIVGVAAHLLFSPFLLVIVAVVAWLALRSRGSRR